jgi:hypothetical protein
MTMPENSTGGTARLPDVNLTAAGSGRNVNLAKIGVPSILIFPGKDNADAALEVNKVVRKQYPKADEVFMASVIDLRSFPSIFRSMVQPALEKAYFNAAGKVSPGTNPADLVVLLPDWDGSVHDTLDVSESTASAAVLVADGQGRIIGRDQGDRPAEAALAAVTDLIGN